MEETAKNILLWHMALQLPYVPVFTKIGTTAHDGQLRLPKTQRGLCRESERKRGEKSFIASDKCTDVLLQLPQHNQERVSERRFGQEEKLVLGMHLSLTLTFPALIQRLDLLGFAFIQLCCKLEERLMHLQGGKHCFGIHSMRFITVCSPTLSSKLICMRWQNCIDLYKNVYHFIINKQLIL